MSRTTSEGQPGPPCAGVGATSWRGKAYLVREDVKAAWCHPANSGRQLRAVVRVLSFYARGYLLHKRTLTPVGLHSAMWAEPAFIATAQVVVGNLPDWTCMQAWKRLLGPSMLFVDVGANVGTYSLWAAELGATVISVEPNAEARSRLLENAALNGVTLEVHPVALADVPGIMRITESLGSMNHLILMNHPTSPDDNRGAEVTVSTLDAILGDRTANGIKIDVEGAERLVLEGAPRALAEGRLPVIQLEWNRMAERNAGESRKKLAALLDRYGYRLCRADAHGQFQPSDWLQVSDLDIFAVLGPD